MAHATSSAPYQPSSHESSAHAQEHGGTGKYIVVFLALCVLTAASFFTTSSLWPFHDRPHIGWAFMMAVSCTKAMLVILFFMHLLWEDKWKYVLTIPAAGMSIFLVCMLIPDVGLRVARYSEERQSYAAELAVADHHAPADQRHNSEGHPPSKHHE